MTVKIQSTKNYDLFDLSKHNRLIKPQKHKGLRESMKQYGFIPQFPIVVIRDENKRLIIWDGQHRFTIARELGLMIHYVEATDKFDVAKINSAQKAWQASDYAECWAQQGSKDYQELLQFSAEYRVAAGRSAALLAGVTTFNNVRAKFESGSFKIVARELAHAVAGTYKLITKSYPECSSSRLIEALMAVYRVSDIDTDRLRDRILKVNGVIKSCGTHDAYLEMLEELYNFKMRQTVPLKFLAQKAMSDRNPSKKTAKT